jgi:transposase-like protein
MTQRAVPYYCPYCGDEDLRPYGETHGQWWCRSCRRAWTLRMVGTGTPDSAPTEKDEEIEM